MPLSKGHMLAHPPNVGVIGAHDNELELVLLDRLLENGVEEGPRFPPTAGEEFVVGRPILLGIAVKTDGSSDGAFADPAHDAKGQGNGPLQGAIPGENRGPAGGLFQQIIQ